MVSLGIDLSASSKQVSTLAFINSQTELIQLSSFKEDGELISVLEIYRPRLIAFAAPLGLPLGLHCLEENCVCKPVNNHKGRVSEVKLARMGISCFFTGKGSIIKGMIYRGIRFRKDLIERGYEVIEVYPYATKRIVFGHEVPAKSKPQSLTYLQARLPSLIRGLEPYIDELNHDRYDAILSAYTAHLHLENETSILGIPEEGLVVIPKLPQ